MSLYIVDIHGEIEGDYELIRKYEEPTTKNNLGVEEVTALAEWTEKLTKASEDAYNKGYADGMKELGPISTKDKFIYGLTACGCLLKDGKTWYEHNELIKCFEDLGLFEQEPTSFQWCTDCKEYDQEKHCCHRWSKVIRNTVEEMKQEQESRKGYLSIDDVMSVFDDFMCGEVDEDGTATFLEMLKDKTDIREVKK